MAPPKKFSGFSSVRLGRAGLRPSEYGLLVLAVLFYLLKPGLQDLHFAPVRARTALSDGFGRLAVSIKNWMSPQTRLGELEERISGLEHDLNISRAELRIQSLQILENDALRAMFLLPGRSLHRYVHAEVVSWSVRRSDARMFVRVTAPDASGSDTFLPGSPVIAPAATSWTPVGQVVGVQKQPGGILAEVMLLSDPQSSVGVMSVDSPSLGGALLVGGGLDRLSLNFAAQPLFYQALTPGSILGTSLDSRFPTGMPVAILVSDAAGGKIHPRPMLTYGDIRFVVILTRFDPVPGPDGLPEPSS